MAGRGGVGSAQSPCRMPVGIGAGGGVGVGRGGGDGRTPQAASAADGRPLRQKANREVGQACGRARPGPPFPALAAALPPLEAPNPTLRLPGVGAKGKWPCEGLWADEVGATPTGRGCRATLARGAPRK